MNQQLTTLCCSLLLAGPVLADTTKERWESEVEQRLQRLEARAGEQEASPEEEGAQAGGWFDSVEIDGLIEVEASRFSPEQGDTESDLNAATVELGLVAQVNDWVGAEILLLYEEETDNDGDFNVDTALITLADPQANWYLKAGRDTLPFGVYPTQMISDPLTLELGETNDTALEAGYAREGLDLSLFVFQGDQSEQLDDFGAQLNYRTVFGGVAWNFNLGYLSNLAESDAIVEAGWVADDDKRAAWIAGLELGFNGWTLIGEYLDATDGFAEASDEAPSAFNLELDYALELFERPAMLALGYQGTRDAEDDLWELPERRVTGAFAIELLEQTTLGFEYRRDESYEGDNDDTLLAQLAIEF